MFSLVDRSVFGSVFSFVFDVVRTKILGLVCTRDLEIVDPMMFGLDGLRVLGIVNVAGIRRYWLAQ